MKFSVNRETILKPLQSVAGAVERRHTLPILSNLLIKVSDDLLTMVGTDLEVELCAQVPVAAGSEAGAVTVPAKKLVDICRTLPDQADITIEVSGERALIRSGRSRFTLSTLPEQEFPQIEEPEQAMTFTLPQRSLRRLIERTQFSMANQDVRYYLNGMLFDTATGWLTAVATDGHRLAMAKEPCAELMEEHQCIVPRKGILELMRLLEAIDDPVTLQLSDNHLRATVPGFTFTSKLVDGRFPDYRRVLPKGGNNILEADKSTLRQALSRVAILSNEKFRGVRLQLSAEELRISANNPEQEEAEEVVAVNYQGVDMEIGFNVSYLLDVLNALEGDEVTIIMNDPNSSGLLQEKDDELGQYVVMPMRL